MENWRVIFDGRHPAAFNMAADAYLLEMAEKGHRPPVLRLYGWNQPSITIGYHQRPERAVDLSLLGDTPIVRRITGGRALCHDDGEITYAMAGNYVRYPALGSSLHRSYDLISKAIVTFYRELGWPAVISHRDQPISPNSRTRVQKGCFAAISRYEIMVFGHKAAAGSQRRTNTSFLQHGAIRIAPPKRHPAIVEAAELVDGKGLGGGVREPEGLKENLTKIFSNIYNVSFFPKPFTASERAAIEDLIPATIIGKLD